MQEDAISVNGGACKADHSCLIAADTSKLFSFFPRQKKILLREIIDPLRHRQMIERKKKGE
jgi:hypothetical protein